MSLILPCVIEFLTHWDARSQTALRTLEAMIRECTALRVCTTSCVLSLMYMWTRITYQVAAWILFSYVPSWCSKSLASAVVVFRNYVDVFSCFAIFCAALLCALWQLCYRPTFVSSAMLSCMTIVLPRLMIQTLVAILALLFVPFGRAHLVESPWQIFHGFRHISHTRICSSSPNVLVLVSDFLLLSRPSLSFLVLGEVEMVFSRVQTWSNVGGPIVRVVRSYEVHRDSSLLPVLVSTSDPVLYGSLMEAPNTNSERRMENRLY